MNEPQLPQTDTAGRVVRVHREDNPLKAMLDWLSQDERESVKPDPRWQQAPDYLND